MQLHACLLLLIITTDKTLALLHHHCGGNISLDRDPAGHINLTLPGHFTDTGTPNLTTHQPEETPPVSVCTWVIDVPPGWTVLLKLAWLEGGSSVSVCCWNDEEDHVLKSGGTVLLSGCGKNKATLSWTAARRSSNAIQLSYYAREDGRNSSEDHTRPHSEQDPQTGTSFTSAAPVGRELGTEGGRGRLYEGLEEEGSSGPQSVSGPSSQDQGLLQPTTPLQGLTAAGRADRETLPLPEEGPNNGAETSGAAHLTDGPISASERTRPYFQQTASTDTQFHAETSTDNELLQTQTALSSDTTQGTEEYTQTSKPPEATQASSSIPNPTSSPPELPSWASGTIISPHGGAVSGAPEEKPSWRSQRSTDRLDSDPTSGVTSDPLQARTEEAQQVVSNSTHTGTGPSSSWIHSSTARIAELDAAVGTAEAAPLHPNVSQAAGSTASDVTSRTPALDTTDRFEMLHVSSSQSRTNSPRSTEAPPPSSSGTSKDETATQSTRRSFAPANTVSPSPGVTKVDDWTSTGSSSTPALTLGDVVQHSVSLETTETSTLHPTSTPFHAHSPTNSPTPVPHVSSPSHSTFSDGPHATHASLPSTATVRTPPVDLKTTTVPSQPSTVPPTPSHTALVQNRLPSPSPTGVPASPEQSHRFVTATHTPPLPLTTARSDRGDVWYPSSTQSSTAGLLPSTTWRPSLENHTAVTTTPLFTPSATWSSTTGPKPKFYIVPDQPAAIKVESIELLLQIIVVESRSAFTSGLEEDTAAWVQPYLQRAPGFGRLLGVWSSGHAVQSLVEFKTRGALQWLSATGPTSLLERTGLAQAVREGQSFRSSRITNITLGGLQADVCDWLLQCQTGYKCVSQPGSSNYSCSSVCHFDYCHHHGICTHHPGQLPVCRCLVGEDFWFMGQRCDMRMTRARLVGACLAILLVMVTVIGVLAFVAVRRYRAMLIQAKVDQTRSSYRRFNHFDELSGRFWLRSWAGSADSLDNPAFTRSDELLHLRALDRPCCYHDDTLSLASTCPSHGTRINTIYPHSSQYAWRGSEVSVGDGVLDSGKASDLSVCSWPVEPIQWTPFPLLQQLASHRSPTVRVSRPRSYCEGMELADLGKSWTA